MKPGRPTGGPFRPIATNVPGIAGLRADAEDGAADGQDRRHPLDADLRGRSSRRHLPDAHRLPAVGQRPLPGGRRHRRQVSGRSRGPTCPTSSRSSSQGDAGAGFLGPKYQPFGIGPEGSLPPFSVSAWNRPGELRRHELRSFVEDRFTAETQSEVAQMHREAYEGARRLQKARDAFKIDAEWAEVPRPVRRQRVRQALPAGPAARRSRRGLRRGRAVELRRARRQLRLAPRPVAADGARLGRPA